MPSSKAQKAKKVKNQPSIKNYFKRKQDEVRDPIPATSRPTKRRRVCGLDDGSDGDGSGCKNSVLEKQLPSGEGDRKMDSVQKASPSLLKCGDSEMDCVHNATPIDDDSALISDGEQDVVDDEVGDNEYIAGPDDVDVEAKFEVIVTYTTSSLATPVNTDTVFAGILRKVLVRLKSWASDNEVISMPEDKKPITVGYWGLLSRLSVDFILPLFLSGISKEVQGLFQKQEWTLEDLKSLPEIKGDKRQGIYANFATGKIEHPNEAGCETYVGSSRSLQKRVSQHMEIVRGSSSKDAKSLHYRQISRKDVQTNFRRLAVFSRPIEPGYLLMLEAIFMILFDTYQFPGYVTKWATEDSYKLTKFLRKDLELPSVSWRGMNAAWPLRQGFFNKSAKKPSPCANPPCEVMTYPKALLPAEGVPKGNRRNAEVGNPLGRYVCGRCSNYMSKNKSLPDKTWIDRILQRQATRAAAGKDPVCACCDRSESQLRTRRRYDRLGKMLLLQHDLLPDKLLCHACFQFYSNNKRLRTPEETEIFLDSSFLGDARLAGGPIRCDNCDVIEGSIHSGNQPHLTNREAKKVLCTRCDQQYRKTHTFSSQGLIESRKTKVDIEAERKAGRPVKCHNCGAVEGSSLANKKNYNISQTDGNVYCSPCGVYYSVHGTHRDPKTARYTEKSQELKESREQNRQVVCEDCQAVEGSSSTFGKFLVNKKSAEILCKPCGKKRWAIKK